MKHLLPILLLFSFILNATELPLNPDQLLQDMTLRQKIAQLCIAAAISNQQFNKDFMASYGHPLDQKYVEALICNEQIGGILFLGGGFTQEQAALTKRFQELSPTIPLLIALDAEWGLTMRLKNGVRFPHNMTLGALADNDLIYQMAYEIGKQLAAIGVHINLAPVMDINNHPANVVIHDRSFGSNPEKVAQKGIAYMRGLHDAGITDCLKHFPGHGDTDGDSHVALPIISHDRAHLDAIELVPFKAAIVHGSKAVMTGHIQLPILEPNQTLGASLSKNITTDLLRNELGFQGLIITDGLAHMKGVKDHYESGIIELMALKAGADILLAPDAIKAINVIEQAVKNGIISEEEINQKVLRVLHAKSWAFSQQKKAVTPLAEVIKLKKKLYAKAITIAKDTLDPHRDKSMDATIAITNMHKLKRQQFGITQETLAEIKQLKEVGKKVTVILYGSPYAVEFVQDADRIIVAYEDDAAAQEAVQQILAGFATAEGALPI